MGILVESVERTEDGTPISVTVEYQGARIKWSRRRGPRRAVIIVAHSGYMSDPIFEKAQKRARAILCCEKRNN